MSGSRAGDYARTNSPESEAPTGDGKHWTLQQFTEINNKPYYALQRHSDAGVMWQCTGYRYEINAVMAAHRITPELLDPIAEDDFFARFETPQEPDDFTRPAVYCPQP